jgi:tRNA(His) guanylyltransferase
VKDSLGDKFKELESLTDVRLMRGLPALARVDGKAFHTFTKGLDRPYDSRLSNLMVDTAKFLAQETNALLAYTQSDEISLLWYADPTSPGSQIFFDGRVTKMVGELTALASLYFNELLPNVLPDKAGRRTRFDARIFNTPSQDDSVLYFKWREKDATRNSVSMAASAYYSHKQLEGKNTSQKHDLLFAAGVNWNNYPTFFKRGTYIKKVKQESVYTAEEIDNLPAKHAARTNPNLTVLRSQYKIEDVPPMGLTKEFAFGGI